MTTQSRIEEILARLPVLQKRRDTIPAEAARISIAAGLAQFNDGVRARPVGTKQAKEKIRQMIKLSRDLRKAIGTMPVNVCDALDSYPYPIVDQSPSRGRQPDRRLPIYLVEDDLPNFILAAEWADKHIRGDPVAGGSPGKYKAKAVTQIAAGVYERLTGAGAGFSVISTGVETEQDYVTKNKATGPFLDFLEELFAVCGINGNAEYFTKKFLKEKTHRAK